MYQVWQVAVVHQQSLLHWQSPYLQKDGIKQKLTLQPFDENDAAYEI